MSEHEDSPLGFLAREGYFLKKIFSSLSAHKLIEKRPAFYLFTSRTFLFRICIADPYSWEYSCKHKFEGSIDDFLCARFGFTHAVTQKIFSKQLLGEVVSLPEDFDRITSIFYQHLDLLNNAVAKSRGVYRDYISSLPLFSGNKPILVDVGYSGTIQKLLTRLLGHDTLGLYFITTAQGIYKQNGTTAQIHSVFKDKVKMGGGYAMLDKSLFLESLLTAPNGQLIDMYKLSNPLLEKEVFRPVFGRVSYTQANFEELEAVFRGVCEAVVHFFQTGVRFSKVQIEEMYEVYTSSPQMIPSVLRPLFDVDDAISGNKNVKPLQLFGL
ncbi:HAD family hydrolase [Agaribacter flavus]|uniref:HAD family hydrolase n=1 Tax=Agaribacter flavus TaxID=1902781 RepID=A0ABV7FR86_9ALTE